MSTENRLHIGCHLSCSGGYLAMGRQAEAIGADTFQFFTRNPRGGAVKAFDAQDAAALTGFMRERRFAPILAHAPYTLNACSADAAVRDFAHRVMREDLERLEHIPGVMLNFHPGSHVGQGVRKGIELIAQMLDEVMTEDIHTMVLLETMAGKGSEVGASFEELACVMERARCGSRLGVCLDTCHVFDGGYDIVGNRRASPSCAPPTRRYISTSWRTRPSTVSCLIRSPKTWSFRQRSSTP